MKLKKCLREHPIPACIAVALLVFVLLGAVGLVRKLLPVNLPIDYARQFVNILWPLALTILLGYAWCYRRGSFAKTLHAGLFAFILFSLSFFIRLGDAQVVGDHASEYCLLPEADAENIENAKADPGRRFP